MSREAPRGRAALRELPFSAVAVRKGDALLRLTERSEIVATKRLWQHSFTGTSPNMEVSQDRSALHMIKIQVSQIPFGGMTLDEQDVQEAYASEEVTFKDHIDRISEDFSRRLRTPGINTTRTARQFIGEYLDFLHLIDDSVEEESPNKFRQRASFTDGVGIITESLREHNIKPSVMAYLFLDLYHFESRDNGQADALIDMEEMRTDYDRLLLFRSKYWSGLTTDEKFDFVSGEIDYDLR